MVSTRVEIDIKEEHGSFTTRMLYFRDRCYEVLVKTRRARYRRESQRAERGVSLLQRADGGWYDPGVLIIGSIAFYRLRAWISRAGASRGMCLRDTLSTDMKRYSRIVFRVIEMALESSRCLDMNEGLSLSLFRACLYLACLSFLICWRFSRWHVLAFFESVRRWESPSRRREFEFLAFDSRIEGWRDQFLSWLKKGHGNEEDRDEFVYLLNFMRD